MLFDLLKIKTFFLLLFFSLCLSVDSFGQPCSCNDLLQELIIKVQTNYAGYIHKVKESKDSDA